VEVRMSDNQVDGREEAPGYTPTRDKMRALARYWVKKKLDHEFGDPPFAEGRLAALAEAAGEDLVNKATEQVNEELRGENDHFWDRGFLTDRVVPGYTPTPEEVRVLVRFWVKTCFSIPYHIFLFQQSGTREFRDHDFACERLGALEEASGEDLVGEATKQVEEELRARVGDHIWDCFQRDDREALGDIWGDDVDDPPSAEAG
jgi:hypothetical protein